MPAAVATLRPLPNETHPPVVVTVTLTVPGGPRIADAARRLADEVRALATEAGAAADLPVLVETAVSAVLDLEPSRRSDISPPIPAGDTGSPPVPEQADRLAAAPDLVLLPDRRLALLEGEPLGLTRREYDLLLFLVTNHGRAYTRPQLLRQVWGYHVVSGERTVDVHVRRLRVKLRGRGPRIATVRGIGYRLDRSQRSSIVTG